MKSMIGGFAWGPHRGPSMMLWWWLRHDDDDDDDDDDATSMLQSKLSRHEM